MEPKDLLAFIHKAHKCTYAAPKEVKEKYKLIPPRRPGYKEFCFLDGDWEYHDSYSGSEMAPGEETVSFQGKPVWSMSYRGKGVEGVTYDFLKEEIFPFLKKTLMNISEDLPFRGPREFVEGDFKYTFEFEGDYSYFRGREAVLYQGNEVFFQDIIGSLIK